jgi:hypothetical protein
VANGRQRALGNRMDVGAWLRGLGFEHYAQAFAENHIHANLLEQLTGEDLKDLGVTSVGHRKRPIADNNKKSMSSR